MEGTLFLVMPRLLLRQSVAVAVAYIQRRELQACQQVLQVDRVAAGQTQIQVLLSMLEAQELRAKEMVEEPHLIQAQALMLAVKTAVVVVQERSAAHLHQQAPEVRVALD